MRYDFAVIGGGSAGYAAARTAVSEGLSTVVIEGGPEVGGLCILKGCMPSKALIESANRFRTLERAEEFGLRASGIAVRSDEILARKARLIGEFAEYRQKQLEDGGFDFMRGRASFETPNQVCVESLKGGTETVEAGCFLIATGSEVRVPDVPGLTDIDFITSDQALELTPFPESMIVLGAGPVALELAHYFSTLGVQVSVVQRSTQVLRGIDPDIAAVVQSALAEHGMEIYTDTQIRMIRPLADGRKEVSFDYEGRRVDLVVEVVLNALGRSANSKGLGLQLAGVETKNETVLASPTMQTTNPSIFASGDVCGPFEVVHMAINQGEVAARNAARVLGFRKGETLEKVDYRLKLFAVFTEPEVAVVGMTELEADATGISVAVATYPFADHGKSLVMGETQGFVKLIMNLATGEICGGAVVGPHASDLIHEIVVAMACRITPAQLAAVPHYHPTLSEIWTYPAEELAGLWNKTRKG